MKNVIGKNFMEHFERGAERMHFMAAARAFRVSELDLLHDERGC